MQYFSIDKYIELVNLNLKDNCKAVIDSYRPRARRLLKLEIYSPNEYEAKNLKASQEGRLSKQNQQSFFEGMFFVLDNIHLFRLPEDINK